jgi:methionine-rich copper-binding protein CopC
MNITYRTVSLLRHIVLSFVVLGFTSNAFAHADLEKTIPAANANLASAPTELVLVYEKPVMLMKLTLNEAIKGTDVNFNFKASSNLMETHKFPLPNLGEGQYTVNWTAMGKDGHNMSGSFTFVVGLPSINKPSTEKTEGMQHSGMKDHSGTPSMDHSK